MAYLIFRTPSRPSSRRSAVFAAVALIAAAAASQSCAKTEPPAKTPQAAAASAAPPPPPPPAPMTLVPADVARTTLVATVVAPSLNKALDAGVALARQATPLPLDAAAVRELAFNQLGVPPEFAAQLDLDAPMSAAVVAVGHDQPAKAALSFAVKAGTDVPKAMAALGTIVARRGAAFQVHTPRNGDGWFLPMGNIVLFADSDLAMSQAANLALEARRPSKDALSVVLFPDGVARASGTDVKTAEQRLLALIDQNAEQSGAKMGPVEREQLRELVAYGADIATAEIALDLDVKKGVTLLARLQAKPASNLEGVSHNVQAMPLDPLLIGNSDATVVVTSTYANHALNQLRRYRTRLPAGNGKDVVAAAKLMDALIEGLTGTLSTVGRLQPQLAVESTFPVKDAAAAAKIEAALLAADRAAMATWFRSEVVGSAVDVKIKQVKVVNLGKQRAAYWNASVAVPNDAAGVTKKLLGPRGLDIYAAVANKDRLVFTAGPTAKARMTAILANKAQPAKGDVADAIALADKRSAFYYVDLREAVAMGAAFGGKELAPQIKMLSSLLKGPMPVVGGLAGDPQGHVLTLDLTVPPSCLVGLGGLVGGLLGPAGAMLPGSASSMR